MKNMSGVERIAKERERQISEEGWTSEHDDEHEEGALALAAALFATDELLYRKREYANQTLFEDPWPWEARWDKRPRKGHGNVLAPNSILPIIKRIRQLEKSGALVAAEIDRLLRKREADKET